MKTLAIVGDIVDSRKLEPRARFQEKLSRTLEGVGAHAVGLASPYTITLGDEFQAVYERADSVFADIFTILAETYPVRIRFAIGVGEITTRINRKQALGMDGPAFHNARSAMTELKGGGKLLAVAGGPGKAWALINPVLSLISHQVDGWRENRMRIMAGLLRDKGIIPISNGLKISRVATYKNINAGALHETGSALGEVTRLLDEEIHAP